ncbi:hypothetical protein UM89_14840 [Bacillus subtilis]|nr:hypothetical protein UM89_14840 [Bacillus subtilis]
MRKERLGGMSIVNFLGCNVTRPFSDDGSKDKILVGECFTDVEMRKKVSIFQLSKCTKFLQMNM